MSIALTLFSRPGCHLCGIMKEQIHRLTGEGFDIALEEVDVDQRPQARKYSEEIPVLHLNGRKIAKIRVSDADLRRKLETARG